MPDIEAADNYACEECGLVGVDLDAFSGLYLCAVCIAARLASIEELEWHEQCQSS